MPRKFDLKFIDGRIPGNAVYEKLLKFHNVNIIRLAELNRKAGTNEKTGVRRKVRKLNVFDKSISIPQEEDNFDKIRLKK